MGGSTLTKKIKLPINDIPQDDIKYDEILNYEELEGLLFNWGSLTLNSKRQVHILSEANAPIFMALKKILCINSGLKRNKIGRNNLYMKDF